MGYISMPTRRACTKVVFHLDSPGFSHFYPPLPNPGMIQLMNLWEYTTSSSALAAVRCGVFFFS